ncbi:MAG TPA: hypothetical protein ENG03_04485 [Thioploca sp.]|nr:MAG: hypothetical protein B6247_31135 [Beggiatoa sp. 4572_84]RKZ46094.1 MAG: hypothetical protein DRR08_33585 [Gammaproteobacteria bacterium]HDN26344.1 hypothetical protein [Thioploca sp.]
MALGCRGNPKGKARLKAKMTTSTMLRKSWIPITYFLFIIMLLASGWMAYSAAGNYERKTEELTDKLHTKPKVKTLLKWLAEGATFKIYKGYSTELEEVEALMAEIEIYKKRAIFATIAFFVLSVFFLAFVYWLISKPALFILTLLVISSIALAVGLFAPILMIVGYKEMPMLGEVVFLFQSKGIITTIGTLWTSGNVVVAIPLFLFSVMIPFLKTLLMGLALFGHALASKSLHLIKYIGKWSMADVFVVALLLTFFTLNKDKSTDAQVQIGLYFFACYVILSMIASHLLTKSK